MKSIIARLSQAGVENAQSDARKLCEHFTGEALEIAILRRVAREPMSHILGYRDFWRDRFIVTKDVLDPRPDSELFIELLLNNPPPTRILDLGCGSGALGCSALREFPEAHCVFVDLSKVALDIARQNATALGFGDHSEFVHSDWLENVVGNFNLILCNPPYISDDEMQNLSPEVNLEPPTALTPRGDGLASYRLISKMIARYLAKDGIAYFEHGHLQQTAVVEIFADAGFETREFQDINLKPRIVSITHKNTN